VADGSTSVTLLEIGRVQGFDEFSGSAMVHNHSSTVASIRASFSPRGASAPSAQVFFNLPAGHTIGWDDVVSQLLNRTGEVGTLVLSTLNGTRISAVGREFAVYRDSGGQVVGTAGQLMPGLTFNDLLVPGRTYHLTGLRHGGMERSHLAVFNPGAGDVVVSVTSFAADGSSKGSNQRTVSSGRLARLDSILKTLDPGHDGGERRLEVTVSGNAHVLAYLVNGTGDPVTLRPIGGPLPRRVVRSVAGDLVDGAGVGAK
jgi:hypothetical protein